MKCSRRHMRKNKTFDAIIKVSDNIVLYGTILDISLGGAFFTPDRLYYYGKFISSGDLFYHIKHRDKVIIIFNRNKEITMKCTIVWIGRHSRHDVYGAGVVFHKTLNPLILI